jgi:hypothetical protein
MLIAFAGAMWGVYALVHAGTETFGFLFPWVGFALLLLIARAYDRHHC